MMDATTRGRRPLVYPDRYQADERQTLTDMLDLYRTILARKAEGLGADDLRATVAASSLTLGGVIKHMAFVEDFWFTSQFAGADAPEPWASAPWEDERDWELDSATSDPPGVLLALFDEAVDRSRAVLEAARTLDQLSAAEDPVRGRFNLRWIVVHMIEEYARHCGHADLLRESVDGTTGD